MTLPMVTCPLCCQPGFSSSDSLCSALINVTTRKLCCPICNYVVVGLDKFTIHLFTHSLSKYGMENLKDSVLTCQSNNANSAASRIIPCSNSTFEAEPITSPNLSNSLVKLQHNVIQDSDLNSFDKREWKMDNKNQHELQKSLNIPDTSLICFHSDNGQLFTISTDVGPTLKNVTINTQNYITNTNITTSTVQASMTEKVQKRRYSQVFERDLVDTCKVFDQKSPDVESVNSWPSTPSVLSESDKQSFNNFSEREFESCKDLLTKGDFSTLSDDINEMELKKDGCYPNKIKNEEILEAHEKKTVPVKKDSLNCELCPYTFPNKTILAMHKQLIHKKVDIDIENKPKLLLCNLCPRTFSLQSSLMIHRRVAHAGGFGNSESDNAKQPPTKPACNICGKFFKKEIHLSQHMKAHDEKQWQCTICSKTFTTKYFLKKHRRLHTGETPYKCNTCSKSFTFQQSYHKHLLYHNDEKPYCCAQCGRLFKELSTLHNHERIHSGEKPFSCETCGKSFRQRVSYLVHRRIHTGAMPYQCTACNKRFRYKISQRTHKCSVNPPGVVVRTSGYLVERLQAAMIKASGEREKKTKQNEMDEKLPYHSKEPLSSESSTSLKSVTDISTSLQNSCTASSGLENNNAEGNLSKTADLKKNSSDKPQIYLLVKGPNEETYYQPLVLTQNNLILNQNNYAQTSEKYMINNSKSKLMEKNVDTDKQNNDFEVNISDIFMDSVDTNQNLQDERVQPLPNYYPTNTQEKGDDNLRMVGEKNEGYQVIKNSMNCISNGKNDKDQSFCETNEGPTNISSDEYEMNDIISSLACQFSEAQNSPGASIQKVNSLKSGSSSGDIVMVDSNDLFSLILSPSQSSPSECLGRLSLSPITITQQALMNNNFDPAEILPDNFNETNEVQKDSLFDTINDDTLKELLFGSTK